MRCRARRSAHREARGGEMGEQKTGQCNTSFLSGGQIGDRNIRCVGEADPIEGIQGRHPCVAEKITDKVEVFLGRHNRFRASRWPMRWRHSGNVRSLTPETAMRPPVWRSWPPRMASKVDFPAPLRPVIIRASPGDNVKETLSKIRRPPRSHRRFSTVSCKRDAP